MFRDRQYSYLQDYSFGGRLAGHQDLTQSIQRCIKSLYRQVLQNVLLFIV